MTAEQRRSRISVRLHETHQPISATALARELGVSRLDVEQFMARMEGAAPLSQLTDGIHLHSLSCPDEASYEHLKARLRELGFLAE